MELIREQLQKPMIAGVVGVIIGLIIGLFWGYIVAPVEWVDGPMSSARADLKEDYLRMAVDSYQKNLDADKAQKRYKEVGEAADAILAEMLAAPGKQDQQAIQDFIASVDSTPEMPTSEPPAEEGQGSNTTLFLVMCVVTILLGGALAAYFLFRPGKKESMSPAAEAMRVTSEYEQTDFEAREGDKPMSQFMTTYMLGDDLFDDSFSIDSPTGEFLGECGVGISESVGVGEPKKVTAFEVWLFDKNDIQTVTTVLMSQYAFADDALRGRLEAKGEPFLVEPGAESELNTATLRLICRVVDMSYGSGASPDQGFFDRVTLELAVWQK